MYQKGQRQVSLICTSLVENSSSEAHADPEPIEVERSIPRLNGLLCPCLLCCLEQFDPRHQGRSFIKWTEAYHISGEAWGGCGWSSHSCAVR